MYGVPEGKTIPESIREIPESLFSHDVVQEVPLGATRAVDSLTSLEQRDYRHVSTKSLSPTHLPTHFYCTISGCAGYGDIVL